MKKQGINLLSWLLLLSMGSILTGMGLAIAILRIGGKL
jgi:hypothetical protein